MGMRGFQGEYNLQYVDSGAQVVLLDAMLTSLDLLVLDW
jgi:hypothetical protein